MTTYRGLTWDHPRGRAALEAAAAQLGDSGTSDLRIEWDVHPLSGFESAPIDELAQRYDLIVLDHPHLGDALVNDSLHPLESLFEPAELSAWAEASVGPSWSSYFYEGSQWALPLDAATQVGAIRADLVDRAPQTWADVDRLADQVPVALSLAGPHAFLTFSSLCVALGEEPKVDSAADGRGYVSDLRGLVALQTMRRISSKAPKGSAELDPISMLEEMASGTTIAYSPLIYGYVNYSARGVAFVDAPADEGGRRGSTVGGTGLAFTRRSQPDRELLDHARWLMSSETQREFIPAHEGQPSTKDAWRDDSVNAASNDFYRRTRSTIDQAWCRPRYPHSVEFQGAASGVIRDVMLDRCTPQNGLDEIQALHAHYTALAWHATAPATHVPATEGQPS